MRLSQLPQGKRAVVTKLFLTGSFKTRLLDMGLYPGAYVKMILAAPFGDPLVISVMGYELFLRKKEAASIEIRPLEKEN